MKEFFIIANWKCNPGSRKEAESLLNAVEAAGKGKNIKTVICPPFVYLYALAFKKGAELGSQDCFWGRGPYTGEISAKMLKGLGCKYAIIGHSERRKFCGETDKIVNKKIKAVLKEGLIPVLCSENISRAKKRLSGIKNTEKVILAYEPSWAISTSKGGKAFSANKAFGKATAFKKALGIKSAIIYGGSVNSKNVKEYIKAGFGGVLVGEASLKAEEFIKIIKETEKNL